MFRFATIRRRLLLRAGFVIVLSGSVLMVVHSGLVRRFALVQLESRLGNALSLVINAKELDYNLLVNRIELKDLEIRGVRMKDMPAPAKAERVVVLIPTWDLVRGTFENAQIRIDGLVIHWHTAPDGRNNWPTFASSQGGGKPGGPSVLVTSGSFILQNDPTGYRVVLPVKRASATWDQAKAGYAILGESARGQLEWGGSVLPVDRLQVKSTFGREGLSLESLQLSSGESAVNISGMMSGTPERIEAAGTLALNVNELSRAMLTMPKARGRLQARLSATGSPAALKIGVALEGEDLVVNEVPIRRPVLDAEFDIATGEVRIRNLSASVFSGQLRGNGRLSATGGEHSEFNARLDGINVRNAAGALGYPGAPNERASMELHGTGRGLDWRYGTVSGTAVLSAAKVSFRASSSGDSVRALFDSSVDDSGTMHGDVTLRTGDGAISGKLDGKVDSMARLAGKLRPLLGDSTSSLTKSELDGAVQFSAALGGTYKLPSAGLRFQADGLSIGGMTGADLAGEVDYNGKRIEIGSARLNWGGQQVDLKGEIEGLTADSPLRLEGTVGGPSLAGVFGKLGIVIPVEAAVSGDLRIAGSLSHPVAEATLQAAELTAYGQSFASTRLDARWQDRVLTVGRFTAEQPNEAGTPGKLEAKGKLNVATSQYEFDTVARDLRISEVALADGIPLSGTIQLEGNGKGTLSDPAFTANLTGTDVMAGSNSFREVQLKVTGTGHRAIAEMEIPSFHTKVSSTVSMGGAWPFEATAVAKNTHLDTNPAVTFDATVRAGGTLLRPSLEKASAEVRELKLESSAAEVRNENPIELSYANGRVRVEQFTLSSGTSKLSVSGEMPLENGQPAGAIALQGTINIGPLGKLLPDSSALEIGGLVDVNGSINGTLQNWQPGGSLTLRDGHLRSGSIPQPVEAIGGRLNLKDGMVVLEQFTGKVGTGTLRFDGTVPYGLISTAIPNAEATVRQPARFSAKLEDLQLTGGTVDRPAQLVVAAKIEGEASELSIAGVRALGELNKLEVKTANADLQQKSAARISIAGGVARLEDFELQGGNSSLKVAGSLGLTGPFPIKVEASGETDLAAITVLESAVETSGAVRLDIQMGGTLSDPKTTGYVELKKASLALTNPPLQGANIDLRADFKGDRVTLSQFNGNLNGGTLQGGGGLTLGTSGLRDVNLFVKGKDMFSEYPATVKTVSALDLQLVSREGRLVLQGAIEIQEGYQDSTLDLFSKSKATGDSSAEESTSSPLELDIKIVTKRPVEMDNNLGRLSATADLRLGGNISQPRLTGMVALEEDGRLYFGDRAYDVERGTVRFLDGPRITPDLNILATTRAGDYTVRLGLTGGLDELTTTFTSDPPLSRDDVIAVLLTGKTLAENPGVDMRSLEATSLATGALNASLSSQLHRTFGVSRVSIQPAAIAAESNPGARVTITQDFTRDFRLMYSMNLSDSNDQIWVGEYDLSRRFTTRAVKQSDNTYRGEFRHDIRFGSSSGGATAAALSKGKRMISAIDFSGGGPFTPEELTKVLRVKAGKKYKAIKVRKGIERLSAFLAKKGYLESRVRLDRKEEGESIGFTFRIELGPVVEMTFAGANLPGRQQSRMRDRWHTGISDQQRPKAVKEAMLSYFADKGYLRAEVDVHTSVNADHKLVRLDLKPGVQYKKIGIAVEGADPQRAGDIVALVSHNPLRVAVHRDPAQVIESVTGYYKKRGYLTAKVTAPVYHLDPEKRTARVVIPIREGPLFHVEALHFSGNQALTATDLEIGLPLERKAVFEPARLEPTVAALKRKYGSLGYREAEIEYQTVRSDDRGTVEVSFKVVENLQTSVDTIKVEGNLHTSEKFARSQIRIDDGGLANTELIRESVKNLSQTGAYTSADVEVRPIVDPGIGDRPIKVADLVVSVAEPKPFRLLYGGLYDSGNGPGFIADFQNLNSLGAGRVLGLRTRVDSETDEIRLYLTQPTWRTRRISTTLATYFTRETEDYQTTPTQKLGVSVQQDIHLRSRLMLSYGYRYEKQRGFVPDPAAPYIPESIVAVAPVTFTISRDTRDSFLDATHGSFISHGTEFAPKFLGSDYPYMRYYGQYFKYFSLMRPRPVPYGEKARPSRLVFATGSRIGLQKGFNSTGAVLTDRFYAGGGTTVRGFRQDELGPKLSNGEPAGGNAVLVLNEELRYPLFWFFDAVTFVDIGNVFPRVSDFRLPDLRSAGGFGLRIRNPFVVLRFDYGFKFGRRPGETVGAFFFSIGQAF